MKIKILKALKDHKAGDIIEVSDKAGTPLDKYWRRRLKDAERDHCVEVIKLEKKGGNK